MTILNCYLIETKHKQFGNHPPGLLPILSIWGGTNGVLNHEMLGDLVAFTWLSPGFTYMHLQTPQKIQGTAMSVESLFGRTTCGLSMHPFLTSSAGMLRCSLENGGVRGPFRFWSVWFWHQLFFEQTKGPLMSTFPPAEVIGCSQTWITIQKDPERSRKATSPWDKWVFYN